MLETLITRLEDLATSRRQLADRIHVLASMIYDNDPRFLAQAQFAHIEAAIYASVVKIVHEELVKLPPVPPPVFTAHHVIAAFEGGYEDGFYDGYAQGMEDFRDG